MPTSDAPLARALLPWLPWPLELPLGAAPELLGALDCGPDGVLPPEAEAPPEVEAAPAPAPLPEAFPDPVAGPSQW